MKSYSLVIAILIFLVSNVFAFSNKNNNTATEKDSKVNIPMGINMQFDSGIMYNTLLLSATTNNGQPPKENGALRLGRGLVLVGVPTLIFSGLLGIPYLITRIFEIEDDFGVSGILFQGMLYGVSFIIPMTFSGGVLWGIGAMVQNVREIEYYQKQIENSTSTNEFSYRFRKIMLIQSKQEYSRINYAR